MGVDSLAPRVIQALEHAPCSLRALAREAGVPHSTLVAIRKGDRTPTWEVADKLRSALSLWGERCHVAAAFIEGAHSEAAKQVAAAERRSREGGR